MLTKVIYLTQLNPTLQLNYTYFYCKERLWEFELSTWVRVITSVKIGNFNQHISCFSVNLQDIELKILGQDTMHDEVRIEMTIFTFH